MYSSADIIQHSRRLAEQDPTLSVIPLEHIEVSSDAFTAIGPYVLSKQWQHIMVVYDDNTAPIANMVMEHIQESRITCTRHCIQPNAVGDVVADESRLIPLFIDMEANMDAIFAVGSGTIHDIVRFVSAKTNRPFVSIPTAASVDGFTSAGAPLIVGGMKKTYQTGAPIALFADLTTLCAAPQALTAAGFADMIGKTTSLVDWHISRLLADEPYQQYADEVTYDALQACRTNRHDIARRDPDGIDKLMGALINSGLSMLLINYSRPASGAEHHLSHYWEMTFLREGRRQVLHGAKVGVATAIIAELYAQLAQTAVLDFADRLPAEKANKLREHWPTIQQRLQSIPPAPEIRSWLQEMEAPATADDLHISRELVREALKQAHHIRPRYTGLSLIHDLAMLDEFVS